MEIIHLLITNEGFWATIGALIGGTFSPALLYFASLFKINVAIHQELRVIKLQIPGKKDIVSQIQSHLSNKRILSGLSVRIASNVYLSNIAKINLHYSQKERYLLHIIYERLRVADEILEKFEYDIRADIQQKVLQSPFDYYSGKMDDLLKSYELVIELVDLYLSGKINKAYVLISN